MTRRWLLGLLVAALALAVTGCSAIGDKVTEEVGEEVAGDAVGGDVEVDNGSVTITGENGDVTVADSGTELPKEFPQQFPMQEDLTLESASSITSDSDTSFYVAWVSTESSDSIYDWYKSKFTADGWEIVGDMKSATEDGTVAIISAKKDNMEGSVTIADKDSGSDVAVVLTTAK